MKTSASLNLAARCRSYAKGAGLTAVTVGASVLLGWCLRMDVLTSVVPGLVAMNPATAVAFILSGMALWRINADFADGPPGSRRLVRMSALIVAVIACLRLVGYVFGWDVGVDAWLFHSALESPATGHPNRMAPNTAANFLLLGGALLLLDSSRERRILAAQLLSSVVAGVALLALLGYAYGAKQFYGVALFIPMAVNTAVTFFVLAAGVLSAKADSGMMRLLTNDGAAGQTARRLLPAAIAAPAAIGWLRLRGQSAGFYGTEFGTSLMVTAIILIFMAVIYWNARLLHRMEIRREEADEALKKAHEDLKLRVRELTAAEEKIRLLLDSTAEAIYGIDLEGRCTFANRACQELLGYERGGELIGRNMHSLAHHRHADGSPYPNEDCRIFQSFRKGLKCHVSDEVLWRADGASVPVEYWAYPLLQEGRPAGAIVTFFDIRERLEAERKLRESEVALRKSHDALEMRVSERTAELAKSNEELRHEMKEKAGLQAQLVQSQKMEAVGRLAGGVAHDFNNLLTAISGYSKFLLESLALDDPRRADVEEIQKAGERAAALTRQLLAFSRQQVLQPKVVEINGIVRDMENMLHRIIGEDVQIVAVLAEGIGRIKADPGQIEQVILNLAVNARDAMPKGGKLTIETANIELGEEYTRSHPEVQPGPFVMLAISDTGTGMDPQTLTRIFEPFFTTKEQGKGTGLGLSTVYGIVKQSGGSIFVYSEPGHGTSFKLYFPRIADAAEARPKPAESKNVRGSETILLVEDDNLVRKFMRRVLDEAGYALMEAAGPEEALAASAAHQGRIHLLLTDIVMPGMRGDDLARKILSIRPDIKVIFTSGYTEAGVVRREMLDSDAIFIQKPVDPGALRLKIRSVLDGPKAETA